MPRKAQWSGWSRGRCIYRRYSRTDRGRPLREDRQAESTRRRTQRSTCTAAGTSSADPKVLSRRLFLELPLLGSRSFARQFFLEQLFLVQVGVIAALRQELGVIASFNNPPIAQHYDLVGVLHGGNAMRNQHGCPLPQN